MFCFWRPSRRNWYVDSSGHSFRIICLTIPSNSGGHISGLFFKTHRECWNMFNLSHCSSLNNWSSSFGAPWVVGYFMYIFIWSNETITWCYIRSTRYSFPTIPSSLPLVRQGPKASIQAKTQRTLLSMQYRNTPQTRWSPFSNPHFPQFLTLISLSPPFLPYSHLPDFQYIAKTFQPSWGPPKGSRIYVFCLLQPESRKIFRFFRYINNRLTHWYSAHCSSEIRVSR